MRSINTEIYAQLDEKWYTAKDDPVALLRAEAKFRNPWVLSEIQRRLGPGTHRVLDVGCGAGFLSNPLAAAGLRVTGVDMAEEALEVARRHDPTRSVRYLAGDFLQIPLETASFDVVCAMDFLEHVTNVREIVGHIQSLLRPGGIFFFLTYNRNPLSRLIAIKGVEWFVKNTPPDLHLYEMFIKPAELEAHCTQHGLRVDEWKGLGPRVFTKAFWKLLTTREVSEDFEFRFYRSLWLGYLGVAIKIGSHR